MTEMGEQLTLKGETEQGLESVFSFNRAMEVSYALNMEDRSKVEIRMTHPDEKQHETFQMIFVLKGKISFTKQGETHSCGQISTQQHNLCRIALRSTRMMMSHFEDDILCINLSNTFLKRYLPANHPAQRRLAAMQKAKEPTMLFPLNMHITPEISAILQQLGGFSRSGFSDQLLLESKVIELLALQISQFEQVEANPVAFKLKEEQLEKMQKAREILIHHTGEQLSLRSLAHLVGTNEFNLKRDFKTAFGSTVYGYLNQHKMEKARLMLISEDITIEEIAKRTGYKYATHFTNAFKKYFGYLPNKIRSGKLVLLILAQDLFTIFEDLDLLIGL